MYLIKMDCITKDEVLVEKLRDVVKSLIDNRELLHFSMQIQKETEVQGRPPTEHRGEPVEAEG